MAREGRITVSSAPNNRVIVWTAPRCISTAFERCVAEIPHGKVFHEPFTSAYYFGPQRVSRRYESEPVDERQSYDRIAAKLTDCQEGKDYVFVKDMAYCVRDRYGMFTSEERFASFKHTFLIRDPAKAILSLYKASMDSKLTGWDYFDEAEAGFKEMFELYTALTDAGHRVAVLDCADLLSDPEGMMQQYCNATGLAYKPGMTSWKAGPLPDWDVWNGWHDDAIKSTGFKPKPKQSNVSEQPVLRAPEEVQTAIDRAQVHYLKLHAVRMVPEAPSLL